MSRDNTTSYTYDDDNVGAEYAPRKDCVFSCDADAGELSAPMIDDKRRAVFMDSLCDGSYARDTLEITGTWETRYQNLYGNIPTQLGLLTTLSTLRLGSNYLSGSMPSQLALLTQLQTLDLGWLRLSGSIPTQLAGLAGAGSLIELDLGNNAALSGAIPTQMAEASELTSLELCRSAISAALPSELGRLSSLRHLILEETMLSGVVPSQLGHLERLQSVRLSDTQCSGTLPPQLADAGSLRMLEAFGNQLSGTLPSQLVRLPLNTLRLSDNPLSGVVPTELGAVDTCEELTLARTAVSGTLPSHLGRLSELRWLAAYDAPLSGVLPSELTLLPNLTTLILSTTSLSGTIPAGLAARRWESLDLSANAFSGSLPTFDSASFFCELGGSNAYLCPLPNLTLACRGSDTEPLRCVDEVASDGSAWAVTMIWLSLAAALAVLCVCALLLRRRLATRFKRPADMFTSALMATFVPPTPAMIDMPSLASGAFKASPAPPEAAGLALLANPGTVSTSKISVQPLLMARGGSPGGQVSSGTESTDVIGGSSGGRVSSDSPGEASPPPWDSGETPPLPDETAAMAATRPLALPAGFTESFAVDLARRDHKYRGFLPLYVLGRGAQATVVLLHDGESSPVVAKQIDAASLSAKRVQAVQAEVLILKELCHKTRHVVRCFDCYSDGHTVSIIMEYAASGTLQQVMAAHSKAGARFSPACVHVWLYQLASALQLLHSERVLHRDIKPANVLLAANGDAKLADFGLSTRVGTERESFMASTFCGTPFYVSPEEAREQRYGPPADVWALGVLLYEMITLTRPFEAESVRLLLLSLRKADVLAVDTAVAQSLIDSNYPHELTVITTSMFTLNPEPEERCTASALLGYVRDDAVMRSTGIAGEEQLREPHEDCRAACSGNASAMEQQLQQALETASADDTQTEQAAVRREFAQRVAKSRARESEVQGGQAAMQAACEALPVSRGSDVV